MGMEIFRKKPIICQEIKILKMTMIMVITKKPIKMGMGMIRILENKYQKMNKKEIAY